MKFRPDIKIPPRINRKIGQAMHDYSMFADGDRVMVAVSGGVDSLSLAIILKIWQQKAPIRFDLSAQIIDQGFWKEHAGVVGPEQSIGTQLEWFSIDYMIDDAWETGDEEKTCFQCARNRRSQLFNLARERGYNKIALGHHKDDLIETFFLNIVYSGNISTMLPKQPLFEGRLSLCRPLAYLEKKDVIEISHAAALSPVENLCPLAADTRREKVRVMLDTIYASEPGAKSSMFAALANVKEEYMPGQIK